jgi:hypothetical protein
MPRDAARATRSGWVEDDAGRRSRVWPPPSELLELSEEAHDDAARGLALLSRASRAAHEDQLAEEEAAQGAAARRALRRGERAQAAEAWGERRGAHHLRGPPPMDAGAWRQWSDEAGCVRWQGCPAPLHCPTPQRGAARAVLLHARGVATRKSARPNSCAC